MKKKTAIIGATPKEDRYAFQATKKLKNHGHPVIPLGVREGVIEEETILTQWPEEISDLDTVTMYIGKARQEALYNYIIGLKPKRVVFNPGTENPDFYTLLNKAGIEHEEACTLVLLSIDQY